MLHSAFPAVMNCVPRDCEPKSEPYWHFLHKLLIVSQVLLSSQYVILFILLKKQTKNLCIFYGFSFILYLMKVKPRALRLGKNTDSMIIYDQTRIVDPAIQLFGDLAVSSPLWLTILYQKLLQPNSRWTEIELQLTSL